MLSPGSVVVVTFLVLKQILPSYGMDLECATAPSGLTGAPVTPQNMTSHTRLVSPATLTLQRILGQNEHNQIQNKLYLKYPSIFFWEL